MGNQSDQDTLPPELAIVHFFGHFLRRRSCRGASHAAIAEAARAYVNQVKSSCFLWGPSDNPAMMRKLLPDAATMRTLGIDMSDTTTILRLRGEVHKSTYCFDHTCVQCFDEDSKRIEKGR